MAPWGSKSLPSVVCMPPRDHREQSRPPATPPPRWLEAAQHLPTPRLPRFVLLSANGLGTHLKQPTVEFPCPETSCPGPTRSRKTSCETGISADDGIRRLADGSSPTRLHRARPDASVVHVSDVHPQDREDSPRRLLRTAHRVSGER